MNNLNAIYERILEVLQNISEEQLSMLYRSETTSLEQGEVILSEYLTNG